MRAGFRVLKIKAWGKLGLRVGNWGLGLKAKGFGFKLRVSGFCWFQRSRQLSAHKTMSNSEVGHSGNIKSTEAFQKYETLQLQQLRKLFWAFALNAVQHSMTEVVESLATSHHSRSPHVEVFRPHPDPVTTHRFLPER